MNFYYIIEERNNKFVVQSIEIVNDANGNAQRKLSADIAEFNDLKEAKDYIIALKELRSYDNK